MKRAPIINAAAALLVAEHYLPIALSLSNAERGAIRDMINQPTAKRAKVKAARKQRNAK